MVQPSWVNTYRIATTCCCVSRLVLLIVSHYMSLEVKPIAKIRGSRVTDLAVGLTIVVVVVCGRRVVVSSSLVVVCDVIMAIPAYRTIGATLLRSIYCLERILMLAKDCSGDKPLC